MKNLFLTLTLLSSSLLCNAQFTAENDYRRQKEIYPFIELVVFQPSDSVKTTMNVVYSTAQGRPLHVDIFSPTFVNEKTPLVLLIHGGGWAGGNKTLDHALAGAFAKQGISAVAVEYRLSGEAIYPAAVQDVKTAIRWAKKEAANYGWDTTNITLMGTSAGGQLVSLVGSLNGLFEKFQTNEHAQFSDRVHKVVNIDGVQAFIHPVSEERMSAGRFFGVTAEENPDLWNEGSALTHVNPGSAKFLYFSSSSPRFTAGYVEMMEKLREYNIKNQMFNIPETPHTFWFYEPWFSQILIPIVAFVKE